MHCRELKDVAVYVRLNLMNLAAGDEDRISLVQKDCVFHTCLGIDKQKIDTSLLEVHRFCLVHVEVKSSLLPFLDVKDLSTVIRDILDPDLVTPATFVSIGLLQVLLFQLRHLSAAPSN